MTNDDMKIAKIIAGVVGLVFLLILFFSTVKFVDQGERRVVTQFGKVNRTLDPGIHFVMPFVESTTKYEVRTQKIEVQAGSASKDLQSVQTTIALNFNIDPNQITAVYADVRTDYMVRIVEPSIQEAVKASTALFNAEALITQRTAVKDEIQKRLSERLNRRGIIVTDVSIVDFQFSEEFDKAIEAKVTAEQRALEAENKLKQIEFESQQRVTQAEGEAEAIRIQAEAITSQGGREYVNLQAIQKWNGQLPTNFVPGSALPFIQLPN